MFYPCYILVEALKWHLKSLVDISCRFVPVTAVPHADLFHLNGHVGWMVGLHLVWYTIMPLCSQSRHFDWYYWFSCLCLPILCVHPPTLLQRLGVTTVVAWTVTEFYCSWFSELLAWETLWLGKVNGFTFSIRIHMPSHGINMWI